MNKTLFLVITSLSLVSTAQTDSSHLIKDVEIKSFKSNLSRKSYITELHSANSLQSQFSDIYVKNNGFGQVSTISVRGMSPANTTVLWEGIPINSIMLGDYDLNMLPNSNLQSISYQFDNTRLSSGGNFEISQPNSSKNQLSLSTLAYHSNVFKHSLEGIVNFGKSRISLIQQYTLGENNFDFINANNEKAKMTKNEVKSMNTQLYFNHRFNKFELNAGLWRIDQDRVTPDNQFFPSDAKLTDLNYRAFLGFKTKELEVKMSYHNEDQEFNDKSPFGSVSTHKVTSYKGLINYVKQFDAKRKLTYTLYPNHFIIESTGYPEKKTLSEAIQQVNFEYSPNELTKLEAGLKSQINTNFAELFLPYLSITSKITNKLSTSIIGDINQRNPTANDLYYMDAWGSKGNVNLLPEENFQIRNLWKYETNSSSDKLKLTAEPYFLYSQNNIKWVPDANFNYSPINIAEVKNFGFNTNIEWLKTLSSSYKLRSILGFNLIDSKNETGKTIVYTPQHKTIVSLGLVHREYEVLIQNNYTASRFASLDNSVKLKPYFLTNLKLAYKLPIIGQNLQLNTGIDNLWNENYQEVNGYFLPLRNYYIGAQWLLQ